MATTVYGCVNVPDGMITFDLSAGVFNCLAQSACIVVSGVHEGQVALTLSDGFQAECNDTFYGCVNKTTGKFQILIPDECCIYSCPECYPEETPPRYITIVFSGVRDCSDDSFFSWNGLHILQQYPAHGICRWYKITGSIEIYLDLFSDFDGLFRINVWHRTEYYTYFYYDSEETCTESGLHSNAWDIGNCGGTPEPPEMEVQGYGGKAQWEVGALLCTDILSGWVIDHSYSIGDKVQLVGDCYYCILAHTSDAINSPPNATYWTEFE